MSSSSAAIRFDETTMWVDLVDGRILGIPLSWFPVLQQATAEQRRDYWISVSGNGLHWDEIDEDISVEGLLAGRGDQTNRNRRTAAAE
ncbi:MAG: hypothetical protein JWR75_603 [Devosia sp.]|nr:hypothetical protein [Devosia sp.]